MADSVRAWTTDANALRLLALRYVPTLAGLSLAWEAAHAPLYTLWWEERALTVLFAVAHCALGDVLIGTAALALALILQRAGPLQGWHFARIAATATVIGVAYLVFSEWLNVTVLERWTYAASMPRIHMGALELGVTPLLQWLVLPAAALRLARGRGPSVSRTYEVRKAMNATPARAFAFLDDFRALSAHMAKRSPMMLGSSMTIETDALDGRAVGSRVRMAGRVLGIPLLLAEVVIERLPPVRKVWQTLEARLLVIGQYRLGFALSPAPMDTRATAVKDPVCAACRSIRRARPPAPRMRTTMRRRRSRARSTPALCIRRSCKTGPGRVRNAAWRSFP